VRPEPGELLHFSEDPSIRTFEPHVARTAQEPESYVWAVDASLAPAYWFPRECPRAMAWVVARTSVRDRDRVLGPGGGSRVHAVEYGWLDALRSTRLYAYRLPATSFRPFGDPRPHAWVSTEAVRPLSGPTPVPDLLGLHEEAGIQLRVLPDLRPFWDVVVTTSLEFSGIRLHNARSQLHESACS
jgi:hypothetical protein